MCFLILSVILQISGGRGAHADSDIQKLADEVAGRLLAIGERVRRYRAEDIAS